MPRASRQERRAELLARGGRFLLAIAVGTVGGFAFWALSLPLPFMLGSMVASMAAAMAGLRTEAPTQARSAMSAVIGAMIGAAFLPEMLGELAGWALPLVTLALFVVVAAATSVTLFRVVFRFDMPTAWFAGMPGGLADMVTMADEQGADLRRVSVIHGLRIAITVFTLPVAIGLITGADLSGAPADAVRLGDADADFYLWFAATIIVGTILGRVLRLPARHILGPMIVSAAIHLAGWSDYRLPVELVVAAQIVIGAAIGGRFQGTNWRQLGAMLPAAACSMVLLLGLAVLFALVVGAAADMSPVALLLAYAPGGFAEMGLVALALGIETAFVATHHVARIALVSLLGGLLFRLFLEDDTENGA